MSQQDHIAPAEAGDSDSGKGLQLQLLRRCLIVGMAFVAGFSVINLSLGFYALGWIEMGMLMTLSLAVWWSYRGAPLVWLRVIITLHAGFLFFFMFFHGGSSALGYVWVLGFPFVVAFMFGSRAGLGWSFIYAAALVLCWLAGWADGGRLDFQWRDVAYLGVVYLAFSMLAFLTTMLREKGERLAQESQLQFKREAEALAESESRYKVLLDSSPNAIGVSRHGKWVYMNPAALTLFAAENMEEILDTIVLDYIHPDYHAMAIEHMRMQEKENITLSVVEEKLVRRSGEVFTAEVQTRPVIFEGEPAFLTGCTDISARKRYEQEKLALQNQLEHAQRLESLGVLAGGIAHDYNNLLAAILGNAELARMEVDESEQGVRYFENIEEACDQASKLSKQMLMYAGKGSYLLEVLNVNSMVRSMSRLIRASVSSQINLRVKFDSSLPCIEGDGSQIRQVILNFIINGAEAIGGESGEIKLTTKTVWAKRNFLDKLYNGTNLPEGEYVMIEVKDTGCGMDKELQSKIFDPFFTTKDTGTGLGLSTVLGIVRGHKGAVELISEPGQGTTFAILIPATDKPPATKIVTTGEIEGWQGEGTILIVDDDVSVREVAKAIVKKFHFDVLTANDGREGVNVFRKHHEKIIAVLLDMTMPQLGGIDAMREIREIEPSVPIILVSGYSQVDVASLTQGDQPDDFVQKPFKGKDLKKSLYRVLYRTGGI